MIHAIDTASFMKAGAIITALDANPERKGCCFYNSTNKTLFVALGPEVSSTHYSAQIHSGSLYEVPSTYTGVITILPCAGCNGLIQVTDW